MKTDRDKSTMIAYKSLLCFYVSCKSILKVSPSLSPQLRFLLPFITVISTFLGAFFGRRGLSVNKAVDDKRREKKTSQEESHIYGWTSRFLSQNAAFSARKSIQSQVNDIWKGFSLDSGTITSQSLKPATENTWMNKKCVKIMTKWLFSVTFLLAVQNFR